MSTLLCLVVLISVLSGSVFSDDGKRETVFVVMLVRNKAHILPYFLSHFDALDYPKHWMQLWIRTDHNSDNTVEVLETWLRRRNQAYHSVSYRTSLQRFDKYDDRYGIYYWSEERYKHVIDLKEEALADARKSWADFVWFIDADVILTNDQTLRTLIESERTIIAPKLDSVGAYSNFWCGMTDKFYYRRTEDYIPILEQKQVGIFDVPMVHSSVLIDLRYEATGKLTFNPNKVAANITLPVDDIIAFAMSANVSGLDLHVTNENDFGYITVPLEMNHTLEDDIDQITFIKTEILVNNPGYSVLPFLSKYLPKPIEPDMMGFDQVYMINLKRRPERRRRMQLTLRDLGIAAVTVDAVDGMTLNSSYLDTMGVKMLPEYLDPYHKRPLTMGEIGCFLSHYQVWKNIVAKHHDVALVFEDDIRFEPYFKKNVMKLIDELTALKPDWQFVYLGRKKLVGEIEPWIEGSSMIVNPSYSYWTLGYAITYEGAKKLLLGDPLPKLVPVDEYIPIMFDKHPQKLWKDYFVDRNLLAYSAAPLLVNPTHYTGDKHYVSDTEQSTIIPPAEEQTHEEL